MLALLPFVLGFLAFFFSSSICSMSSFEFFDALPFLFRSGCVMAEPMESYRLSRLVSVDLPSYASSSSSFIIVSFELRREFELYLSLLLLTLRFY